MAAAIPTHLLTPFRRLARAAQGVGATADLRLILLLSVLLAFASISTDIYLPALPAIGLALHARSGTMDLTISGYLLGFSVGQLFWGPISDRYGRRPPIAAGLVLFVIGSAGCAMSAHATTLIAWRVIEAIGASACVVLARAMVRDLFEGARAARVLSTLITVMAIAPMVGPTVGVWILRLASWRAIFWVLVGIGLLTLGALHLLPETLSQERLRREPMGLALHGYRQLLRSRRLVFNAGAGAFFYGGIYAYVAGTPFAYITFYGVSPQLYGLLFAMGSAGIIASNQVNRYLVGPWRTATLLRLGASIAALSGMVLGLDAYTDWWGVAGLALPLLAFMSANGLIVANSIAEALAVFPDRVGTASALVGAMQYGSGIAGSALVGLCADGTPMSMAWVIAACGIGSLGCAFCAR